MRDILIKRNDPTHKYEPISMEGTDFDWNAVLKSLPSGEAIIGPGVTAFNCRLLPDVLDHNYKKIDSGERHVFEVVRVDGSSILLHFHKHGKCDPLNTRLLQTWLPAGQPSRSMLCQLLMSSSESVRRHPQQGEPR